MGKCTKIYACVQAYAWVYSLLTVVQLTQISCQMSRIFASCELLLYFPARRNFILTTMLFCTPGTINRKALMEKSTVVVLILVVGLAEYALADLKRVLTLLLLLLWRNFYFLLRDCICIFVVSAFLNWIMLCYRAAVTLNRAAATLLLTPRSVWTEAGIYL